MTPAHDPPERLTCAHTRWHREDLPVCDECLRIAQREWSVRQEAYREERAQHRRLYPIIPVKDC